MNTTKSVGIQCPSCNSANSIVKEKRPGPGYNRRRRSCSDCGHLFTTKEAIEGSIPGRPMRLNTEPAREAQVIALRHLQEIAKRAVLIEGLIFGKEE